jgi:hypothetical protein
MEELIDTMEELKDAMQTDSNRTHLSVVERYYTPRFILGITISQFYEYFGSSPQLIDTAMKRDWFGVISIQFTNELNILPS